MLSLKTIVVKIFKNVLKTIKTALKIKSCHLRSIYSAAWSRFSMKFGVTNEKVFEVL